jgi:hypothetical protein
MAQTETQVVAAELERVAPKVPLLFERDSQFYANIEKRPVETISARDMRIPLEIRPGGLFGYFDPAGGDLGRGEGPTFEKALINTVSFKYAVEWHKKTQWATDDARKSVVKSVQNLLANSMKEFRRAVDAQLMTDGTGTLATISVVAGGGPYTLTCSAATDGYGVRLLRYGQKVNIYSADMLTARTPLETDERQITAFDEDAKTVTISGGAITGITAGDRIVASGLRGASPVGILGVPYHHNSASTGQWLSLSRSAYPEVRAARITASGALALPFPRRAVNKIGQRLGMENGIKMKAWMHPCQAQAYEEVGQMMSVINKTASPTEKMDVYFDVQQLAGVPIRKHFNWDKTRIDYVVDEIWGRAEMHPAGFYEEEGRRMFEVRGASGGVAAATLFYLCASFNTYINQPPAAVYISDLSVPAGY